MIKEFLTLVILGVSFSSSLLSEPVTASSNPNAVYNSPTHPSLAATTTITQDEPPKKSWLGNLLGGGGPSREEDNDDHETNPNSKGSGLPPPPPPPPLQKDQQQIGMHRQPPPPPPPPAMQQEESQQQSQSQSQQPLPPRIWGKNVEEYPFQGQAGSENPSAEENDISQQQQQQQPPPPMWGQPPPSFQSPPPPNNYDPWHIQQQQEQPMQHYPQQSNPYDPSTPPPLQEEESTSTAEYINTLQTEINSLLSHQSELYTQIQNLSSNLLDSEMVTDQYQQSIDTLVEQLADAESHASSESMAALEYKRNCTDLGLDIQYLREQVMELEGKCQDMQKDWDCDLETLEETREALKDTKTELETLSCGIELARVEAQQQRLRTESEVKRRKQGSQGGLVSWLLSLLVGSNDDSTMDDSEEEELERVQVGPNKYRESCLFVHFYFIVESNHSFHN